MVFLQSRKSAFLKFQGFENAMKTALSFLVTISLRKGRQRKACGKRALAIAVWYGD
jgi:hypothetical protein